MKVYSDKCPCKGCNERNAECHGKCEKYRQWQNNAVTVQNNNWITYTRQGMWFKAIKNKSRRNNNGRN